MAPELVSCRTHNTGTAWQHQRTLLCGAAAFRITLRRDACDHQSYGRVEYWNGQEWTEVVWSPIEALGCRALHYLDPHVGAAAFDRDCQQLLGEARLIVPPAVGAAFEEIAKYALMVTDPHSDCTPAPDHLQTLYEMCCTALDAAGYDVGSPAAGPLRRKTKTAGETCD